MIDMGSEQNATDRVIIVSGLPRSGTSMMMQMLEAGGTEIVTDGIRQADNDNPKGYYEFEKVKKMREGTQWLDGCAGKAVKMVSPLLPQLPDGRKYRVIFMKRDLREVLSSQNVMLKRLGRQGANISDEEMIEKFSAHLNQIRDWLAKKDNFDVIYINFKDVVRHPHETAVTVKNFLGQPMDTAAMGKVVEQKLYRQKRLEN
jgi:hypothetical protein